MADQFVYLQQKSFKAVNAAAVMQCARQPSLLILGSPFSAPDEGINGGSPYSGANLAPRRVPGLLAAHLTSYQERDADCKGSRERQACEGHSRY